MRAALAVLLLALAAPPTAGLAADPEVLQTSEFARALPLDRGYAGHLKGGRDGNFAYYRFHYPADGSTATVNVQVWPDDAVVLKNVGIKIFGPRPNKEYVVGGQQHGIRPNVSGNVISQDLNDRGTYTVQVYNYDLNAAVDFTIALQGVAPPAPSPTPSTPLTAVAAPTNTTGDAPLPLGVERQKGELGPGGQQFRYYSFAYPGDESVVAVNLQVWPDEALLLRNVGFRIYGPRPDSSPLTAGTQQGLQPNLARNVIGRDRGTYVVQLYNYDPTRTVAFEVWASGLPAAPTPRAGG